MSTLNQLPFVKLIIPFLMGIFLTLCWPCLAPIGILPLILCLLTCITLYFFKKTIFLEVLTNIFLLLSFLSLGIYLTGKHSPEFTKKRIEAVGLEGVYFVVVSDIPQVKTKTYKIKASIIGKITKAQKFVSSDAEVIIYINRKGRLPILGDKLIIHCKFSPIPEPENPYQFNYKQFLEYQGIQYQTTINDTQDIIYTHINSATFLQKLAFNGTTYLKRLFRESIKDTVALAVTESLIFGFKDDIPKDLVNAYSRTGTLHVLAVSGMHVAVVFLLLSKLFWFIDYFKQGIWLKTIFILMSIWGYCILTGLAPSILRAGFTISLILIGKSLSRHYNIYNIITFSAFIILCFNPFTLLNVGFQLSFSAVIGIIYLQQYLLPIYKPQNFITREIWNILIITLCAQIATFPISIYYFNQFPNFFLVSNLIIIPLTTLVIYFGTGMVLFSKVHPFFEIFSWLTEKLVILTNYLVLKMENMPYSFTDGISINIFQVLMIYLAIFYLINWYQYFESKSLWIGLFSIVITQGISCYEKIKLQNQNSVVFFNAPKFKLILLSDGSKCVIISNIANPEREMFYIRGWLIHKRIWPAYKRISINNLTDSSINLNEMNLKIKKDGIYFKGYNIKRRLMGDEKINYNRENNQIY